MTRKISTKEKAMKKLLLPLLVLSLFGLNAVAAHAAKPETVTYNFTVVDNEGGRSNPTGDAVLRALPNGKTQVKIQVKGLQPGGQYFVTWSTATGCQLESDNPTKTLEHFTANTNGNLNLNRMVESDLSSIGSIGIRVETGNVLVACAARTP